MISRKNIMHLCGAVLCLALAGLGLSACTDAVSFDASTEAPKVGTSIIGFQYFYDGQGHLQERRADSVVMNVLPTPAVIAGKGSVVPFAIAIDDSSHFGQPPGRPTLDTIYLHYEPNGDVSMKFDGMTLSAPGIGRSVVVPDSWVVLPTGSKVDLTQTLKDTSYTFPVGSTQIPGRVQVVTTQEFLGPKLLATLAGDLSVVGVRVRHVVTLTNNEALQVSVNDYFLHYSPALGAIVQFDQTRLISDGSSSVLRELSHNGWQTFYYTLVK